MHSTAPCSLQPPAYPPASAPPPQVLPTPAVSNPPGNSPTACDLQSATVCFHQPHQIIQLTLANSRFQVVVRYAPAPAYPQNIGERRDNVGEIAGTQHQNGGVPPWQKQARVGAAIPMVQQQQQSSLKQTPAATRQAGKIGFFIKPQLPKSKQGQSAPAYVKVEESKPAQTQVGALVTPV